MPQRKTPGPPPDVLGAGGRAQMLAQQLLELQRQEFALRLTRETNGHSDEDRMPLAGIEAESWPTYESRERQIMEAIARLWAVDPSLEAQVRELIAEAGSPPER